VFLLDDTTALVQTVDFFTPVVDDPEAFGAIAAANALSDVYAMGGQPLTALSIAALPERDFPLDWAAAIFRGGAAKLAEAGCLLVGGHTIRDPELKFGYSVTGRVRPDQITTNAGVVPGDALVLSKPLGTGVVATALKAGDAPPQAVDAATQSMSELNAAAADAGRVAGVRGATDVTGFGLLGHAAALARESRVSLRLRVSDLPLLPRARELAGRFQAGGLHANRRAFAPQVAGLTGLDADLEPLLFDPQTSGGLLLAVPPASLDPLLASLPRARLVGYAEAAGESPLVLE